MQMIAISIVSQTIIILANDTELNPGPRSPDSLSICHTNIRSLKAKDRFMHVKCEFVDSYDIITLSETWLKASDRSANFCLPGYQMPFRKDRHTGPGGYGGVIAWISNVIACKQRHDLESIDLEALWLEIRLKNIKFLLCVIYRPPNSGSEFWDHLNEKLDGIKALHNMKLLIIGDLNSNFMTQHGNLLQNFALIQSLSIHNYAPTRITQNSATVLDQCLSNFPSDIKSVAVHAPVSDNDHSTLAVKIRFAKHKTSKYQRTMWNYKAANFDGFRNALNAADWDQCFAMQDVNSICESWSSKLLEYVKQYVPNKLVVVRPNDKPWYNGYLRRLNRKKQRVFKQAKSLKTLQSWVKFSNARALYHNELKRIKNIFESEKYKQLVNDKVIHPKKWWATLNDIYKNADVEDGILPIEIDGNIITKHAIT